MIGERGRRLPLGSRRSYKVAHDVLGFGRSQAFTAIRRKMQVFRILVMLVVLIAGLGGQGAAQDVQRIVALVNDDVVSLYDLNSRLRLVLVSSNLPDTPENRRRIQPQIIRALIDEKLQRQEAERLGIGVTENELQQAVGRIEQANRLGRGGFQRFIEQNGVERSTVYEQVRTGLAWRKVVERRLRSTFDVSDDEIDEQLARLQSAQGSAENLLAEIFLAVDTPEQDEEVRQTAQGLIDQMVRGAPFSAIAQQFSQSASAASAGDIGWVPVGQFDEAINNAIAPLQRGQITPPVRSVAGYYIYLLRDRRSTSGALPEDATVSLAQMVMALPRGAGDAEVRSQGELLQQVREIVKGCDDMERAAKELGAQFGGAPQRFRVGDLAPAIRPAVLRLKIGELSEPIRLDGGLLALMVCERDEPKNTNLPSREEIAEQITRQRLDLAARRYLRDLRRAAVVDIRV
ncbi:MAG TPA: peptidylprolyl isomerase [Alphaproteobacteria bacterium]|nr:peptidylprolyl isomerase [Alphaproteobacteria bacterium]